MGSHSEKVWSSVKSVFILLFQIVKPSGSEQNGSQSWKLGRTQQPIGVCWRQVGCIDFFATWCGPCKMIAPKLEEWSASMPNVVFLKVDVDEAEDVAAEYSIQAMPTFIFMKNKAKVGDLCGANADKLKELITTHA